MHYLYGNSNRCQACVRCMKGVGISKGPLCEVPLYAKKKKNNVHTYVHVLTCTCLNLYKASLVPRPFVEEEEGVKVTLLCT